MELGLSQDMLTWMVIALLLGIIEVFTVGFFFCFFAVGALVTAVATLFVTGVVPQTVIFVLVSLLLVWMARPLLKKMFNVRSRPAMNSNVSALLNTTVYVLEAVDKYQGRVKVTHTGELWSAYLADGNGATIPAGQEAIILKVDGAKLAVGPLQAQ
ncbi:NfeD family protein [Vampirovibrio sp.]|uniref:NfeD family protein n=1 Tax=Vampirovibrio sp. TaxID=2717857 RepID=UPI003593AC9E